MAKILKIVNIFTCRQLTNPSVACYDDSGFRITFHDYPHFAAQVGDPTAELRALVVTSHFILVQINKEGIPCEYSY